MAKSSSSALPGDVEWLPGPGGARRLRIHPPSPEPPALILRGADGTEQRIDAGPGPQTEYEIPEALDWSTAWLQAPDGTRTAIPAPHGRAAEVIVLRPRFARADLKPPAGLAARVDGPPPVIWTTPPQFPRTEGAEAEWSARRADLERELAAAAAAIGRARDGERAARDAVLSALGAARADLRAVRAAREADQSAYVALAGELSAERSAHAVTRGSIGTLADALAAAREAASVADAAGQEARAGVATARREAALARAEAASLRSALETERAARQAAEAELRELNDRAGLLQRVAELDRDAAGLRDQVELERRAREQAEAAAVAARRPPEEAKRLLADLDAAASALRAAATPAAEALASRAEAAAEDLASRAGAATAGDATEGLAPRAGAPTPADAAAGPAPQADAATPAEDASEGLASRADASAADERATAASVPATGAVASSVALVRAGDGARLRKALVALAREDADAAGALLVGLLPAQGAVLTGSLSYDLTVRGIGTFAVTVEDGSARVVRVPRRRPRAEALFHLAADPLVLAELLAGGRHKLGRFRRKARVTGRRKRARELAALPDTRLSLAEAVRAGARLEPALVYRALPLAIEPEWTRGHRFTIAQQIVELAPQSWYISARDGQPLSVVEHRSEAPADATVTMSRAAFERLLRDEPQPFGERPVVRGDRDAVAALKRWTDLARGA